MGVLMEVLVKVLVKADETVMRKKVIWTENETQENEHENEKNTS